MNDIGIKYHQNLANYFKQQPLYLDEKEKTPNTRKLVELPWQLTAIADYDNLFLTIRDSRIFNLLLSFFYKDAVYYWMILHSKTENSINKTYRINEIDSINLIPFSDLLWDCGFKRESIEFISAFPEKQIASMTSSAHFNLLEKRIELLLENEEHESIEVLLSNIQKIYEGRLNYALFGDNSDYILVGKCWALRGRYFRKTNNPDKALSCYTNAVNIFSESSSNFDLSQCYRELGHLNKEAGYTNAARKYYLDDIALQRKMNNYKELANSLYNMALLFIVETDYLIESEELAQNEREYILLSKIHYHRAFILYQQKEFTKAKQELANAKNYLLSDETRIDILLLEGTLAAISKKSIEEIVDYFNQARSLASNINHKYLYQLSLYNIGFCFYENGNLAQAAKWLFEQIEICRENNYSDWLMKGLIVYKDCFEISESKGLDIIYETTKEIVEIAREIDKKGEECFHLSNLAYIEAIFKKDKDNARKYYERAKAINDVLSDHSLSEKLNMLNSLL